MLRQKSLTEDELYAKAAERMLKNLKSGKESAHKYAIKADSMELEATKEAQRAGNAAKHL